MVAQGDVMTSVEASQQLGVCVRQVQRLASSRALTQIGTVGRTMLIDAGSVQRLRARGARRGRPWSAGTIAAALDLLTDGDTSRLSPVARNRLRARLVGLPAEELVQATHVRAVVRRYRASPSLLDRVRKEVAPTGVAAVDSDPALVKAFGLARSAEPPVDGYVDEKSARALIRASHLVEDEQGDVTLRVTSIDSLLTTNAVVVALDLAESLDPRARSAGLAYLRKRLRTLR